LRLAIVDNDRDFAQAVWVASLHAEIEATRPTAGGLDPALLKAAKLDAVAVDPEALGSAFWPWLEVVAAELPELGVLVCAERTDLASRVRGLRLGADDWITKPMAVEEVIARIEAATRGRRTRAPVVEEPIEGGELQMRPAEYTARAGARTIDLTPREFELLHFLLREQGRVLERTAIYERVWGYAMVPGDRSVDTYVRKLRIKLRAASPAWAYLHTHFGIGYRFEAVADAAAPTP
jgi:DNA-binding response OmpR family regulator